MPNGDVIQEVRKLLEDPQNMTSKTAQRLTLSLLYDLYEKFEEDHKRLDEIYPMYRWGRWALLLVAGLGLTDIVTRVLAMIGKGVP